MSNIAAISQVFESAMPADKKLPTGMLPDLQGVRPYINMLLAMFGQGLNFGGHVARCKSPVEADITVQGDKITIHFAKPNQPNVDLKGWMRPPVPSITITPREITLGLGGLPDVSAKVLS